MTAPSTPREALEAMSAFDRESHKGSVIVAELLVETNDLLTQQNGMLRELLEQQRTSATTVVNNAPAGTSAGAGRPAVDNTSAGKEAAVRLTEPDVPPVDGDQDDDTAGGRPAPARKAAAAPDRKAATAAANSSRTRGQRGR